jgi:hypothetical protein
VGSIKSIGKNSPMLRKHYYVCLVLVKHELLQVHTVNNEVSVCNPVLLICTHKTNELVSEDAEE